MKVSNGACLSASKPDMECHWCSTANLCSIGRDTHSKAWMINNCTKINMQKDNKSEQMDKESDQKDNKSDQKDNKSEQMDKESDQKDNKSDQKDNKSEQMDKESDQKDNKSDQKENKSEQKDSKSEQKDNKPMFNYLYVLIPSVICLVIVCVGFIVWFWLSKRQ
ncbi:unnamed protein product [Schistosoma rodhaini]|uniref:Uncharacterized protein n=1 Tax=Schistosoma rodhaini TaxID=6188 RepID=A0AA85FYQ3_9TREM|nr:unnamed protein product [Schistosoma rodhaini]